MRKLKKTKQKTQQLSITYLLIWKHLSPVIIMSTFDSANKTISNSADLKGADVYIFLACRGLLSWQYYQKKYLWYIVKSRRKFRKVWVLRFCCLPPSLEAWIQTSPSASGPGVGFMLFAHVLWRKSNVIALFVGMHSDAIPLQTPCLAICLCSALSVSNLLFI